VSTDDFTPENDPSSEFTTVGALSEDSGPFGRLPRVSSHQARLESRLARLGIGAGIRPALGWLTGSLGTGVGVARPDVLWRPAGLRRVGVVAQFTWPRLSTRFAIGLEAPVAHAVVDRLLGFDRLPADNLLPPSPVEWGILNFVFAETLRRLAAEGHCPFGVWDLTLDRVGPDPFDVSDLGRVVTIRWPLTIGTAVGSIRLWLSGNLVARWLTLEPAPPTDPDELISRAETQLLTGVWKAEAGTIALARGLKTLRAGGVLPLIESRLRGTPQSPGGAVELTLNLSVQGGRFSFAAEPVPLSGGGRLTVTSPLRHEPTPREAIAMTPRPAPSGPEPTPASATEVPVTLVVELGRVNLSLGRLADLKPGDVVELGRHSREPVELTSGGLVVARGELVLIDTELGVRVTHLFL